MKYFFISILVFFVQTLSAQKMSDNERYELAYNHFQNGRFDLAVAEAKHIATDDAQLLIAQCYEGQGYDRAAIRIYKKLISQNNAKAAYYYAAKLYKRGKNDDALSMTQKSISIDKNIPEAHQLLASIMANKGERYKAMLALYYFMLINDNEDSQRLAYQQLVILWRRSAQFIDILGKRNKPSKIDNLIENEIRQLATDDSIAKLEGTESIKAVNSYTQKFFEFLLNNTEDNLDFWQITYTDFFVTLVPRNFIEPYVYFIADATYHPQVLEWINNNQYLFNEFRIWMEAQ